MLASIDFRAMTLQERGLLYTMRLECWVNRTLPADPGRLAKILGIEREDAVGCLPSLMGFFKEQGGTLTCPDLDYYREYLASIRAAQSEGGKRGAKRTNTRRNPEDTIGHSGNPSGESPGYPAGDLRVLRLDKPSTAKLSKTQHARAGDITADESAWVADYDKASNGE